jgi:hypothetical protein
MELSPAGRCTRLCICPARGGGAAQRVSANTCTAKSHPQHNQSERRQRSTTDVPSAAVRTRYGPGNALSAMPVAASPSPGSAHCTALHCWRSGAGVPVIADTVCIPCLSSHLHRHMHCLCRVHNPPRTAVVPGTFRSKRLPFFSSCQLYPAWDRGASHQQATPAGMGAPLPLTWRS